MPPTFTATEKSHAGDTNPAPESSSCSTEDRGDHPKQTWIDRQALSLPEQMPIYKDFLVAWSTPPGEGSVLKGAYISIYLLDVQIVNIM